MTTLRPCKPLRVLGSFAPLDCPLDKAFCRIPGQPPCEHYRGANLTENADRTVVTVVVKCDAPDPEAK